MSFTVLRGLVYKMNINSEHIFW